MFKYGLWVFGINSGLIEGGDDWVDWGGWGIFGGDLFIVVMGLEMVFPLSEGWDDLTLGWRFLTSLLSSLFNSGLVGSLLTGFYLAEGTLVVWTLFTIIDRRVTYIGLRLFAGIEVVTGFRLFTKMLLFESLWSWGWIIIGLPITSLRFDCTTFLRLPPLSSVRQSNLSGIVALCSVAYEYTANTACSNVWMLFCLKNARILAGSAVWSVFRSIVSIMVPIISCSVPSSTLFGRILDRSPFNHTLTTSFESIHIISS